MISAISVSFFFESWEESIRERGENVLENTTAGGDPVRVLNTVQVLVQKQLVQMCFKQLFCITETEQRRAHTYWEESVLSERLIKCIYRQEVALISSLIG